MIAFPNGVTTRSLAVRMTLKPSRVVWVLFMSWKALFGSSCLRSEPLYEPLPGMCWLASGSGLALTASPRSTAWVQRLSDRAPRAAAMAWAWLAVGVRWGATTTLRWFCGSCMVTIRVWARNCCTASVAFPAFAMSPSKAVESRASETIAVLPLPIFRAAVGA